MKRVCEDLPFEVSEDGKIVRNIKTEHIYTQGTDKDGYKTISTRINGVSKYFRVHILISKAYHENPNEYPQVNHKDGAKDNNHKDNLEWCTNSMNQLHAIRTGLRKVQYGEECSSTVLTEEIAHSVCRMIEEGMRNVDIANSLGIDRFQVKDIRRGAAWKLVGEQYNLQKRREGRLSESTIKWVCTQLQDNVSIKTILEMATNPYITRSIVKHIKSRNSHTDVSQHYKF